MPQADTLQSLTSVLRSPLRTVTSHGLLRLSASLKVLFSNKGKINFNHKIFKDLTHFEVLEFPWGCDHWVEGNNLGCLANLCYLSIGYFNLGFESPKEVLRECLRRCKALDVLILPAESIQEVSESSWGRRRIIASDGTVKEMPEDKVVLYPGVYNSDGGCTEGWYRGVIGDDDMWTQSQDIVRRRRWKWELKTISWDSLADSDTLGEWLSEMGAR
ncbi:hypothetical protein AX16_006021 [Volvariella volvacea WC 439]|nr:hypothetical protein AX16_006021 [Volvariella volvacea WC 439]